MERMDRMQEQAATAGTAGATTRLLSGFFSRDSWDSRSRRALALHPADGVFDQFGAAPVA